MLLSVQEIVGGYEPIRIVHGVSLDLETGHRVALLGRNGMGKTTLLRTILGLADRFAGAVSVDGQAIRGRAPTALAKLGVTFVPDDRGIFPRLTVSENLELARLGRYRPAAAEPLELFPDLARRPDQPAGTLSGGQQQQLAIARALVTGPRLLVVDELSQGLQPSIVGLLVRTLGEVAVASDLAILLVEQNPDLAMRICDRVLIMERGRIVASGSADEVREQPRFLDLLSV